MAGVEANIKILADHPTTNHEAANILMNQIFTNHVVTDCILDILSFSDILSSSLVCKFWNNVAKEFLRRRRICLLNCEIEDLEGLGNRQKLLENQVLFSNHPFSGVHFVARKLLDFMPKRFRIKTCIQAIWAVTTKKYIAMTFTEGECVIGTYNYFHNWFFNFLRTQLPKNETEHLRVMGQVTVPWKNFTKINTSHPTLDGFANLRTFESDLVFRLPTDYIPFIHGCPALTNFQAAVDVAKLEMIWEFDKLPLLRWVHLRHSDVVDEDLLEDIEEFEVPLEVLSLHDCYWKPEQIQCVRRLVQLSTKTLQKVILLEYDVEHGYKRYPRLETIPVVVIKHRNSGYRNAALSNDPSEKKIRRAFPNAKIIHDVLNIE